MSIRRHLNYLKYVLRHKWFVLIASIRIKASLYHAITHDLSKFRPSEWFPYAVTFYAPDGSKRYEETTSFASAWAKHQNRNPHHWQYWMLTWDRGNTICLRMPKKYIYEMVADWMGAGRAITGEWEAREWYLKNRDSIKLHVATRGTVDYLLHVKLDDLREATN